jgi:hypothetical protein
MIVASIGRGQITPLFRQGGKCSLGWAWRRARQAATTIGQAQSGHHSERRVSAELRHDLDHRAVAKADNHGLQTLNIGEGFRSHWANGGGPDAG